MYASIGVLLPAAYRKQDRVIRRLQLVKLELILQVEGKFRGGQ